MIWDQRRTYCRFLWMCVYVYVYVRSCVGYNVTFEEEFVEWESPKHHFQLKTASETVNLRGYPGVDRTSGTLQGKFAVATGTSEDPDDSYRVMYSPCFNPTGPRCTLHFSTWMSESEKRTEQLWGVVMPFCHFCRKGDMGETRDLPFIVNASIANSTHRWLQHEVHLGAVHSLFVLALVAYLPNNDSLLALDNISLRDCDLDAEKDVCGAGDFQCTFTSHCIPRHQLCDFLHDCHCGEDETPAVCEHLPKQAQADFRDCDFAEGQCYWYNVKSHEQHEQSWTLTPLAKNVEDRILPSGNQSGAYVYVSALWSQSKWTSSLLRSVDFPALPDPTGLCQLRFSYWLSGDAKLTVQLWELGGLEARTLWRSEDTQNRVHVWERAVVTIDENAVPNSYVLQMRVRAEQGYQKSGLALTNITLSSECFDQEGAKVTLSTCEAEGREGPTPEMCQEGEEREPSDVTVLTHHPLEGAQLWTVPTSAKYSLQAYGAGGGRGREGSGSQLNYAAHVHAHFRLHRGEDLIAIVGQKGQDYFQVANKKGENHTESGGGGGGATFVYRRKPSQEPELLLMAGGGGGLNYLSFIDIQTEPLPRDHWATDLEWTTLTNDTDFKGRGCVLDNGTHLPPLRHAAGGFGAGWGVCGGNGGHGGGAEVTNSSVSWNGTGRPGGVFVHHDQLSADFTLWSHAGPGRLEIRMVNWRCPCDFLCRWHRPQLTDQPEVKVTDGMSFTCICPKGRVLSTDRLSCVVLSPDSTPTAKEGGSVSVASAVIISVVIISLLVLIVGGFFIYVIRTGPDDGLWSLRLVLTRCVRTRSQSLPLQVLPPTSLPARLLQLNPNYSFLTSSSGDHKLPEIPRDNLRIATQLGQGAFGEVYKGFLSGMSGTEREVAVAVKTLPPLCSEQTELDFFMEAFIVSKFHHANIVTFLGVCFQQQPRYIVLELLEGGNLKSFLRECRPPQGSVSELSVGDLLALAEDVCCGCCYLEQRHFIHRDIAARNCLLTTKGPDRVAKIADFGMSRDVYRADYYKKEGRALLPLKWMPPEAFLEGVFTTKTDVWSFGVLLWEILTMGYTPYPALTNSEVMNFIYIGGRLPCPEGCPPAVYDLMLSCWRQKTDERPSFDFIKQSLSTITEDTATMSQHLSAHRLPHLQNSFSGRSLKLLNHPVPSLGLQLHPSPPVNPAPPLPEPTPTQPLLKAAPIPRHVNGLTSKTERFPLINRRSASLDSDNASSRGSWSSLEPLLPPDNHRAQGIDLTPWSHDVGTNEPRERWVCGSVPVKQTEKTGQTGKSSTSCVQSGDKAVSLSSLTTLTENEEVVCETSNESV